MAAGLPVAIFVYIRFIAVDFFTLKWFFCVKFDIFAFTNVKIRKNNHKLYTL